MIQFITLELFDTQSLQKRDRDEHVPVSFDSYIAGGECVFKQTKSG